MRDFERLIEEGEDLQERAAGGWWIIAAAPFGLWLWASAAGWLA